MFVWPGEASRDKIISHLRGKETFVISSCFQRLSLLLWTEGHKNKKLLPKQRACDAVQVHRGFALCKRCIRASSPLLKTTRRPRRLQVRHDNQIAFIMTKGHCQSGLTRQRGLQDSLWMQQNLHRWNAKTYAREMKVRAKKPSSRQLKVQTADLFISYGKQYSRENLVKIGVFTIIPKARMGYEIIKINSHQGL